PNASINEETRFMTIIAWHVESKNFHPSPSQLGHMREKVTELEQYLAGFAPDSAHLQVEAARDLIADTYNAVLTLSLPKKMFRSEGIGKEVNQAFGTSVKELAGQLAAQKPAASRGPQEEARPADRSKTEETGHGQGRRRAVHV